MTDFLNYKNKILTDKKFADAFEYLMSKVVLDKPLPQLKFIYKKHKIILGKNGLYSIYNLDGKKITNKIHYQEVAKYIILNIKNPGKISYIQHVESEMFRHKEKIEFFTKYNNKLDMDVIDAKLGSMYDYYYRYKNSLIELLKEHNLYL